MTVGLLASYHWFRSLDVDQFLDGERTVLFADSGAFSAASTGVEITVAEYADWLDRWAGRFVIVCTLDVIGDWATTAANTAALEEHGHPVMPVFHAGEPWDVLRSYAERYPLVGLGGLVPYATEPRKLRRFLVTCFRETRNTEARFHALGLTNWRILADLPFYSVDSSSWRASLRYGQVNLWDDDRQRPVSVQVGQDPRVMAEHGPLLRAHGLDPAAVGVPGFGRAAGKTPEAYRAEADALLRAGLVAQLRLQGWMRRRHGAVGLAGRPDGPFVFLSIAAAGFNRAYFAGLLASLPDL